MNEFIVNHREIILAILDLGQLIGFGILCRGVWLLVRDERKRKRPQ